MQSQGGFATVLAKGERGGGTILLLMVEHGKNDRLYERMSQLDGSREFVLTKEQDASKPGEMAEYLDRRTRQDPDIWILELDIPNAERFAAVQHK